MTGWTACAVHPLTPAGTPLTGESAAVTSLALEGYELRRRPSETAPGMAGSCAPPRRRNGCRAAAAPATLRSAGQARPRIEECQDKSASRERANGGQRGRRSLAGAATCTAAPASDSTAVADPLLLRSPA